MPPNARWGHFFVMNGQGERLPVYISDKVRLYLRTAPPRWRDTTRIRLLFVLFLARDSEAFGEILMDILLPQMAECRYGMI